ncbi:hypothetical protein ACI0FR_01508 [Paenochrobactrum sp. BZR 201-1]
MNITEKCRKDYVPASCLPSAALVRSPAKSTRRVGRPYWFSIPFGRSVPTSFQQSFRSGMRPNDCIHGSINNRGVTQDHGNLTQERGFFTQALFTGSYLNV